MVAKVLWDSATRTGVLSFSYAWVILWSLDLVVLRGPNIDFINPASRRYLLSRPAIPPKPAFPCRWGMVQIIPARRHVSTYWQLTWLWSAEILSETNTEAWLNKSKVVPSCIFRFRDSLTIPHVVVSHLQNATYPISPLQFYPASRVKHFHYPTSGLDF